MDTWDGIADTLVYHVAVAADWLEARRAGEYRTSTRGLRLDEVGFVHAAFAGQVAVVARTRYRDVGAPLVVLAIDPARLRVPLRVEGVGPDGECFPHIYGPLACDAVVAVLPLDVAADGTVALGDARGTDAAPVAPCASREGCGRRRAEGGRMLGWVGDVEQATLSNGNFREVLFTGGRVQLTVMRLAPGEEIGLEMHDDLDQFVRIEQGRARVTFGRSQDHVDEEHEVEDDWAVIVPGGVWHNVVNVGDEDLKLYSLYAPPEHPRDTVHRTKAEADAAEHH